MNKKVKSAKVLNVFSNRKVHVSLRSSSQAQKFKAALEIQVSQRCSSQMKTCLCGTEISLPYVGKVGGSISAQFGYMVCCFLYKFLGVSLDPLVMLSKIT